MRALLQRLEDVRATVSLHRSAMTHADAKDVPGALSLVAGALDDARQLRDMGDPRAMDVEGDARALLSRIIGALDAR